MNAPPIPSSETGLPIAAVERETGLAKDTLRVWEKRYGFPQPLRDASGNAQSITTSPELGKIKGNKVVQHQIKHVLLSIL